MQPNTQKIEPKSGASPFHAPVARPQMQPMQPPARPSGLWRSIATLGMPGLVLFVLLALAQIAAPPQWRPLYLAAMAMAQYDNTHIAETKQEKADAEELIAQARAEGERDAEFAFQTQLKELEFIYQEKLVTVQTQLQTGLNAYQSLYERANMLQTEAAKMEHTILTNQQNAIRDTQGAIGVAANVTDIGCIFSPEFCQMSDNIRNKMASDLAQAGTVGRGSVAREFLRDIPDPAQLQARIMLPPPAVN